jgi:hypothetical protein
MCLLRKDVILDLIIKVKKEISLKVSFQKRMMCPNCRALEYFKKGCISVMNVNKGMPLKVSFQKKNEVS